jgi:hypothetical protein
MAGTDDVAARIPGTYDTITAAGASADPGQAAHRVPATAASEAVR